MHAEAETLVDLFVHQLRLVLVEPDILLETGAEGGIVYVKPHPKQGRVALRRIEALIAAHGNLRLTGASVHDLNDAARVVVTQNSAAGFEALMQRKPVITCGKCDFRHATLTPRSAGDLAEAIRAAQAGRDIDPAANLYPRAEDGLRSMAAVYAVAESGQANGVWVDARPPMFR